MHFNICYFDEHEIIAHMLIYASLITDKVKHLVLAFCVLGVFVYMTFLF